MKLGASARFREGCTHMFHRPCGAVLGLLFLCLVLTQASGCANISTRPYGPPAASREESGAVSLCGRADMPERIILNLTDAPATSQAVTWRTSGSVGRPWAQIVPASGSVNFNKNAHTVEARTQTVTLGDGCVAHAHSVVFKGLDPATVYAYRVGGAQGAWSEWNQFKTAGSAPLPFSFVYFGDPQVEIRSKCSRVFRAAYRKAPDAAFWLFVGDLVDDGDNDEQWAELFDSFGWISRTTPMVLLPGNHEYPNRRFFIGDNFRLFHLWRPQFTLPENGPAGLEETVYSIDYQGARLVMLNGNERMEEQARWLDLVLSRDPRPSWTIAAIHQPINPTGRHNGKSTPYDLFVPVFDKYGVDLVLQGHTHTYSRSSRLNDGVKVKPEEPGTIYVISVSGPKSSQTNPRYQEQMEKAGSGRQLFQVINVAPDRLNYESYDATGILYDAFALVK